MSFFNIKFIKNFFLSLIFTVLVSTLLSHKHSLRVEGAAYSQISLTPTALPSPTLIPLPTMTITPTPTVITMPTAIPTAVPTLTLVQTTPNMSQSSTAQTNITVVSGNPILDKVNEYRRSKGLSEVKSDSYSCSLAKKRAEEITSNFSHDGFQQRIDNKSFDYPSYSLVVENLGQIGTDGKTVFEMWLDSPSHRENMEKDTTYVCIEQNGNFFAYEGWKP